MSVSWINAIFDRTSADVTNSKLQVQKWIEAIAKGEVITETDLKGYLNITDINRVENNTKYISLYKSSLGLITKTNWIRTDLPTITDIERIIKNINILIDSFEVRPIMYEMPTTILNYQDINVLEHNLLLLKNYIEDTAVKIIVDINIVSQLDMLLAVTSLIRIQAICTNLLENYQTLIACSSTNFSVLINTLNVINSILTNDEITRILIQNINHLSVNVNSHLLQSLIIKVIGLEEQLLVTPKAKLSKSVILKSNNEDKLNTDCYVYVKYKNNIITHLNEILDVLVKTRVSDSVIASLTLKINNVINSNVVGKSPFYIIIDDNIMSILISEVIVNNDLKLIEIDSKNLLSIICNQDVLSVDNLSVVLSSTNGVNVTITNMVYALLSDYDDMTLEELDETPLEILNLKEEKQ